MTINTVVTNAMRWDRTGKPFQDTLNCALVAWTRKLSVYQCAGLNNLATTFDIIKREGVNIMYK